MNAVAKNILSVFLLFTSVCKGQAIRAFGDSFTAGLGANSFECYPDRLAQILNYPSQNLSVNAATSTDVKNYLIQDSAHKSYPTIIWAGYMNIADVNQVVADNQAAMGSLGHQKFIVLSILNNCFRPRGTAPYDNTILVNNQFKQYFGTRFLDVRDSMVHYRSGDAYWDSVSIADDVPNHYLMWDCVHCNASGYYYIAQKIAEKQVILFGGVLALDSLRLSQRRVRNERQQYYVYNMNGVMLKSFASAVKVQPNNILKNYARGLYIICINGKCKKYMRW